MEIPVYNQQRVGPTRSGESYSIAGERRRPVSVPYRGGAAKGLGAVGEALFDIGQRMNEAEEVQDYADAMISATKGFADIQTDIRQNPEYADMGAEELEKIFNEKASELRSTITGNMKKAGAIKAFELQYDKDSTKTAIDVRDFGRQRFISKSRAKTNEELDFFSNHMINTGDLESIAKGQALIDGKVKAGIFSHEEGQQLLKRFKANSIIGYYERLIENPATAKLALEELTRENEPEALSVVDERTQNALVQRARNAASSAQKSQSLGMAYTQMVNRFGKNYEAALDYIENPSHWKKLGLTFETAGMLRTRFSSMLSERNSLEDRARTNYDRLVKENDFDLLINMNDPKKANAIDIESLARRRLISQSAYESAIKQRREGPESDDPFIVSEIESALIRGEDIRGELSKAFNEGKIKSSTFTSIGKRWNDDSYKAGAAYIKRAMAPTPADQWSPDKNTRFADAMELYRAKLKGGIKYEAAAREVVSAYLDNMRRTVRGLARPKYLKGSDKLNRDALEDAKFDTAQAWRSGGISVDEYRMQIESIEKLIELSTDIDDAPDDATLKKELEARKVE